MYRAIRFVLLVVIAYLVIPCFTQGCAEQKVACQVIKLADSACNLIEYVDGAGHKHQVPVTQQELEGLAQAASARHAAQLDAGQ